MELQQLINKANTEELTQEEQEELFTKINEELSALKEKDPEKYLELLKQLNSMIEDLNTDIESL
ncbi:MAG: hypothetical protein JWL75_62 [Parcubacteria group bacterium]|nr:hypothetical protein [Parcubacteria group bacterium]